MDTNTRPRTCVYYCVKKAFILLTFVQPRLHPKHHVHEVNKMHADQFWSSSLKSYSILSPRSKSDWSRSIHMTCCGTQRVLGAVLETSSSRLASQVGQQGTHHILLHCVFGTKPSPDTVSNCSSHDRWVRRLSCNPYKHPGAQCNHTWIGSVVQASIGSTTFKTNPAVQSIWISVYSLCGGESPRPWNATRIGWTSKRAIDAMSPNVNHYGV